MPADAEPPASPGAASPDAPRHGPDGVTGADSNDVGRQIRAEKPTGRYSPIEEERALGAPPNTELPHGPRTGDVGPDGRHPIRMSPEEARAFRDEMGHHLPESPPAAPRDTARFPEADMPGDRPAGGPRTARHPEADMPSDLPGDGPKTTRHAEPDMPPDGPGDPPTGRPGRQPRGPGSRPDGGSGGAAVPEPHAPPEPVHVGPDRSAPTPVRGPDDPSVGLPEREPVRAGRGAGAEPPKTPDAPDAPDGDKTPALEAADREAPKPGPRRSRAERMREEAKIPEPEEFRLDDPAELHQKPTIDEPMEFDPTAPDPVPFVDKAGNPTEVNRLIPGQPRQLGRMENYRSPQNKLYAESVNDYAQDMINDDWDWKLHPDRPIIMDGDVLVSGNHRMTAAQIAADATGRPLMGGVNPIIPDGGVISKAEALKRGMLQKPVDGSLPVIPLKPTSELGVVPGRKPPPIDFADPEADALLEGVRRAKPVE
jgi:hypothetical protein